MIVKKQTSYTRPEASVIEPLARQGMSVSEIRKALGCTEQHVRRCVEKLGLSDMVKVQRRTVDIAEAKRLLESGYKVPAIADMLGFERSVVYRALAKVDVDVKKIPSSYDERRKLVEDLWDQGKNDQEIAILTGMQVFTIRGIRNRHGIVDQPVSFSLPALKSMVADKWSNERIARYFNTTQKQVQDWIADYGIRRTRGKKPKPRARQDKAAADWHSDVRFEDDAEAAKPEPLLRNMPSAVNLVSRAVLDQYNGDC